MEARKHFWYSLLISVITLRLVVVCCKCKYRADYCILCDIHSSVKLINLFFAEQHNNMKPLHEDAWAKRL